MQIAEQFNVSRAEMMVVGDAERDIECAKTYGCKACLVRTGKGLATLSKNPTWQDVPIFADLAAVVEALF